MNLNEALISLGNFCAVRFGLDKVSAATAPATGEVQEFAALASMLGEGEATGLQEAISRIASFCFKHLGEARVMEITSGNPNCLAGALRLATHLGGVAGMAAGAVPGSFKPPARVAAPTKANKGGTTHTPQVQPPAPAPPRDPKLDRLKLLAVAVFGLREVANLLTMVESDSEKYRTLEHLFHLNCLTFPGMRPAAVLSQELVQPPTMDAAEEELRALRQSSIDSLCGNWLGEP